MDEMIYYDQITQSLSESLHYGSSTLADIPTLVKKVIDDQMWKKRTVIATGQVVEFQRFEDYVEARPPEGLGSDMTVLRGMLRHKPDVLIQLDQITKKTLNAPKLNDDKHIIHNMPHPAQQGTSREYTVARLERDGRADLAQQVINREIPAAEARRQAGYEKPRQAVRMDDPYSAAQTILKHMDHAVIADLLAILASAIAEEPQP